jgi:hypothetical protein
VTGIEPALSAWEQDAQCSAATQPGLGSDDVGAIGPSLPWGLENDRVHPPDGAREGHGVARYGMTNKP